MEIKITGTPEEVKKLFTNTGDKELVTKDELDRILSEYVRFANPIKTDDLYAAYSKEATKLIENGAISVFGRPIRWWYQQ